jgi:hypothetical protein
VVWDSRLKRPPAPCRHFPAGELDDGGGAMLPICAGLLPSAAEEEVEAAPSDPYLLADVWAQSLGLQVGGPAGCK